jgi:hypothetical protein
MSTITTFLTGEDACIPASGLNKAYVIKKQLDFSDTNVLAADVVQALQIPAGTMVLNVYVEVVTAEGGTCTATVGDGAGASSWDASTDLNATAGTVTAGISGTDAYALTGKVYTAEDTIDLTMGHNTDAAVINVFAICFDLN